ncbi:uncharacterized protein H6S33_010621 [Morchella sextelata]|uniref:uncharacterized protein n=1 Tax=Morchella sextelata TaxID=1174677 RepID=UPI001D0539A3|nr:uncharacterized protein H6S33_010621 [Morchella sextelata]KAH0611356.1 hypothetical protein H6S33_010621 [Morchella sextelata]
MIAATQSEGSAYHRSSLPHASTTSSVTSSEQWTSARSSASATSTLIQPPPTSARGATPTTTTVFRHHPSSSTSSSASHSSTPIHTHQQHSHPEQPHPTSTPATPSPRSRQSPARSGRRSEDSAPVILQNLSQVVELPREEPLPHSPSRRNRSGEEDRKRYEISGMPVTDVIEMVAGLLTKITTTNDQQHSQMHRGIPPPETSGMSNTTNSVLAFHGKNVPSITILSYLSRIHKYCPTTYEKPTIELEGGVHGLKWGTQLSWLVIAGVTCASKFFSDVFYTNSRYAKVGGLPLQELNHLELQFLILNDFRLAVPVEELEAYGTMLVQFYAREAVANADLRGIGPPADPAAN